jgi:hypothetical protein
LGSSEWKIGLDQGLYGVGIYPSNTGEALGSLGPKIPLLATAMAESGVEAVEFTITNTRNIAYLIQLYDVVGISDGKLNSLNASVEDKTC